MPTRNGPVRVVGDRYQVVRTQDQPRNPSRDAVVAAHVASENLRFLRASWILGSFGNIAAACVYVALAWPDAYHDRLLVWFAIVAAVTVVLAVTSRRARETQRSDDLGIPYASRVAHVCTGIVWGSLFLVELGDSDHQTLLDLCLVFAMSAGTMGGAGIARLGRDVMAPMWTLVVLGSLLSGDRLVAAGGACFATLMVRDLELGQRQLTELVKLRHEADLEARAAGERAEADALTGLSNRHGLQRAAQDMAEHDVQLVTVFFIDLDHFKSVNDEHGHQAGDDVLRVVADRLRHGVRHHDVVCRHGGDEFFILVPGNLSRGRVEQLAEQLIASIEAPIDIRGALARISASIGSTVLPTADFDLDRAYAETDRALHEAKRRGRRRVVAFSDVADATA